MGTVQVKSHKKRLGNKTFTVKGYKRGNKLKPSNKVTYEQLEGKLYIGRDEDGKFRGTKYVPSQRKRVLALRYKQQAKGKKIRKLMQDFTANKLTEREFLTEYKKLSS